MIRDQLPGYAKELIRRAVATKLKIPRDQLIASSDAQAAVDRCVANVKAIADHKTFEAAIDEIYAVRSRVEPNLPRRKVQREIEDCYETFNVEIAGVERMHEMNRSNMEPKDMWDFLRSRVPLGAEYDDDWMRAADAWILRGEVIHLPMGSVRVHPTAPTSLDEACSEKIWDAIIQSAKTKFDYTSFKAAFSKIDNDVVADNVLLQIIEGYAGGGADNEIAAGIRRDFALMGFGFQEGGLEDLLRNKKTELTKEIHAAEVALSSFDMGLQPPGILVAVRSILKSA